MDEVLTEANIPSEVATFQNAEPSNISSEINERYKQHIARLIENEAKDIDWKLSARQWFSRIALLFLVVQNALVFFLVYKAFNANRLAELQVIFSVLVSATLLETIGVVKIMVEFIFKDIKYKIPKF